MATTLATPALTARSVVLSLLLGIRPARLPVRDLVAFGEEFGIAPATMRVALSRMVASGDLTNDDATYTLAPRHLERQAAQEADLDPVVLPHDGSWDVVVITATGRDAATRAGTRAAMRTRHLAELREGVWTRPANLALTLPDDPGLEHFTARHRDERALSARLWDLDGWVEQADALVAASRSDAPLRDRFVVAAAIVRHLRADPQLPEGLRPARWPADDLRTAYDHFRTELSHLRTEETR